MKQLWILVLSVVLLAAAPPDKSKADQQFKEGQRLFGEKSFAAALEEFRKVDALIPNEPQVYSWIGASLNELGQHAEAKERLEAAIKLLRDAQRVAVEKKLAVPTVDLGYFTLLARIQVNLHEFEQAVATMNSYSFTDDGSEEATKAKQALDTAKQTLKAKLVAVGTECLHAADLDCARTTFTQAEALHPATPTVRESVAREALARAEKAPAATDEEKAKRVALYETAVQASRIALEGEGAGSTDAQHVLAKALSGTKTREGYEEAARILTALWEGCADPAQRDSSIQLDLAVAQAGLEQWDLAVASASAFIQLDPNDSLGQGYCMRSFAQFQLGRCQEAIDDGSHCKNADGSQRQLKHLEVCEQRRVKQEADKAAASARAREAREAELQRQCTHLYKKVEWARSLLGEISLNEVVEILDEVKAREAECRPYFEAAEKKESGNGFSSPTPQLCAAAAKTASFPLNLSQRSKEELESLRDKTQDLLALCKSSLDATQAASVKDGLRMVEQALDRPH